MEEIEKLARFKWNHHNHSGWAKILQASANHLPLKRTCWIFTLKGVRSLKPQLVLLSFSLFSMLGKNHFNSQPNIFMHCIADKVFLFLRYLKCFSATLTLVTVFHDALTFF